MVRAVIKKVELRNNNPVIILSRTDNTFLEKLMEQEVPEIEDGLITIRNIVRIPGNGPRWRWNPMMTGSIRSALVSV